MSEQINIKSGGSSSDMSIETSTDSSTDSSTEPSTDPSSDPSTEITKSYFYNYPVIFFDLETTGLSPIEEDILDITCITHDKEGNQISFQRYINTEKDITNSYIHGITNDFLNDNVINTSEEILEEFIEFVNSHSNSRGVFLMAHNNFGFDKLFIESWFKREYKKVPDNWVFLDSLQQIKYMNYGYRSNSLGNLYKICFDKEIKEAHTSSGDVKALIDVYFKLVVNKLTDKEYREMLSNNFNFTLVSSFHKDYLKQTIKILDTDYGTMNKLRRNNLDTIEKLLIYYDTDPDTMEACLRYDMKINSRWMRNKIINFISHLSYMKK